MVALFPLDIADRVGVTVAAQVERDVPGATRDMLDGGLFAMATHVGPYEQISLTAHDLLAWIGERGHVSPAELREVYISDPRQTTADQLVTHLMVKIGESE